MSNEKFMGNDEFIAKAKNIVDGYAVHHLDVTDGVPEFEVYVVWNAFILGYQKALLSTTLSDGMYYEVTYNKAKDEIYLDAYKKFENRCILPEDVK